MRNDKSVYQAICRQRLLPLYFHSSADSSIRILKALYAAGIRVLEYTNRGNEAFENFGQLRKIVDLEMKDLFLGIGTIRTAGDAQRFVEAGADFLVSPVMEPAVAEVARQHGRLWIPGCMTPTEIGQAEQKGATLVKVFPGSVLGPSFVSAVREVFPMVSFMPTGGVTMNATDLQGWFKAGVVAVGMGGQLLNAEAIASGNYELITEKAKQALALVNAS